MCVHMHVFLVKLWEAQHRLVLRVVGDDPGCISAGMASDPSLLMVRFVQRAGVSPGLELPLGLRRSSEAFCLALLP